VALRPGGWARGYTILHRKIADLKKKVTHDLGRVILEDLELICFDKYY
jgi:hypothetical protein